MRIHQSKRGRPTSNFKKAYTPVLIGLLTDKIAEKSKRIAAYRTKASFEEGWRFFKDIEHSDTKISRSELRSALDILTKIKILETWDVPSLDKRVKGGLKAWRLKTDKDSNVKVLKMVCLSDNRDLQQVYTKSEYRKNYLHNILHCTLEPLSNETQSMIQDDYILYQMRREFLYKCDDLIEKDPQSADLAYGIYCWIETQSSKKYSQQLKNPKTRERTQKCILTYAGNAAIKAIQPCPENLITKALRRKNLKKGGMKQPKTKRDDSHTIK